MATVPVAALTLLVAQAEVEAGSWAAGQSIASFDEATRVRVLLVSQRSRRTWHPPGETVLGAGQELVIVPTWQGLAQISPHVEAVKRLDHGSGLNWRQE